MFLWNKLPQYFFPGFDCASPSSESPSSQLCAHPQHYNDAPTIFQGRARNNYSHYLTSAGTMDANTVSERVAQLSHTDVLAVFSHKSGKHWLALRNALQEGQVDGADLAGHMSSAESLSTFLSEVAALELPRIIVTLLFRLLCAAPGLPAQQPAAARADAGKNGADDEKAMGAKDDVAAAPAPSQTSLRVKVTRAGQDADLRITVQVATTAAVRAVARRVMERLRLGLTSAIKLVHAGRELHATSAVDWSKLSFVHATVLADTVPLTLRNASSHALVAAKVDLARRLPGADAAPALVNADDKDGLTLQVNDAGGPLGSGACGAVFEGTVSDGVRSRKVAVKKFYHLEGPILHGLESGGQVQAWVERELLPEVNILAGLAHKNVIRLRCVGLHTVLEAVVPAYVATDLCSDGTLQRWIQQGRITDRLMVEFACDLIDAMWYLHHDKKVVHRDIKPGNIFVHDDERQQRPFLVLGDVGLAKTLNRSASVVSGAGTSFYLAPEAGTAARKCSQASDVYSASLVAVELVTGRCVIAECYASDDQATTARLVAEATAKLSSVLEFCGDSWLSSEAAGMLLRACTVQDPSARTSFRAIVAACPRHERTKQEVRRANEALREQQLRDTQAALEAATQQLADCKQQLRDREQQLRDREQQLRDREQQLRDHEQQLRDMQATLAAATQQQANLEPAHQAARTVRKPEQENGQEEKKRRPSPGVVALRQPTPATLAKRTYLCTPAPRHHYASRAMVDRCVCVCASVSLCLVSKWAGLSVTGARTELNLNGNGIAGWYACNLRACNHW